MSLLFCLQLFSVTETMNGEAPPKKKSKKDKKKSRKSMACLEEVKTALEEEEEVAQVQQVSELIRGLYHNPIGCFSFRAEKHIQTHFYC